MVVLVPHVKVKATADEVACHWKPADTSPKHLLHLLMMMMSPLTSLLHPCTHASRMAGCKPACNCFACLTVSVDHRQLAQRSRHKGDAPFHSSIPLLACFVPILLASHSRSHLHLINCRQWMVPYAADTYRQLGIGSILKPPLARVPRARRRRRRILCSGSIQARAECARHPLIFDS